MPKPVIAAVNGTAAGAGAAFAFACDLRLVSDSAVFHLAFGSIGLSWDSGLSWTLPRLVGQGRATELLLRPRPLSASDAVVLGLAH
jgi:2-(1,2-epoxy-1,2-dihydrophenyl)acetyl-CoA isomerase